MLCPRDNTALVPTRFLGIIIDSCPHCDGTYLDAGELAHIHGLAKDLADGPGHEHTDPRGHIPCPKCDTEMMTRWFSESRRILIDRCLACGGIWLDTEELKQILREVGSKAPGTDEQLSSPLNAPDLQMDR
ncbi:MAG: zf-TFIIB domain-containing protein [Armatimonadetes bacterium]|nr:zf-TFIIB domain-containing protein [Armatimonadota bacterium]